MKIPLMGQVEVNGVLMVWERWDIRMLLAKLTSYQPDTVPPEINHEWAYLLPTPNYCPN